MLIGETGIDRVCPVADASSCIPKYHFIAIDKATGLKDDEDGILGLWPANVSGLNEKYSRSLFIPEMVKSGAITQSILSFHLSGMDGKSYMDFGTPNPSAMKGGDPSSVVYIDSLKENAFWSNYVTGLRFTSNTSDLSVKVLTKSEAVTDTGTSCIIGP